MARGQLLALLAPGALALFLAALTPRLEEASGGAGTGGTSGAATAGLRSAARSVRSLATDEGGPPELDPVRKGDPDPGPGGTPWALQQPRVAQPTPSDLEGLRAAIKRELPPLRACRERTVAEGETAWGRMELRWTVAADGSVRDARTTRDTVRHEELRDCVLRGLRGLRFGGIGKPAVVEYLLEFPGP